MEPMPLLFQCLADQLTDRLSSKRGAPVCLFRGAVKHHYVIQAMSMLLQHTQRAGQTPLIHLRVSSLSV